MYRTDELHERIGGGHTREVGSLNLSICAKFAATGGKGRAEIGLREEVQGRIVGGGAQGTYQYLMRRASVGDVLTRKGTLANTTNE